MSPQNQFDLCMTMAKAIVSRYRAEAPSGCDPQNTVSVIGSVVGIAGTAYGVYANNKAQSKAEQAAKAQQQAQAAALKDQQGALQDLFNSEQDPAQVFADIFTQFPDLLSQVLPSLTNQSITASSQLTDANVASFKKALLSLTPQYDRLRGDQVKQIDSLNPDNLGADEIASITKLLSPLIPTGTLDPKSGAVAGGTSNPVSLYRNLISGAYDQRRTQFLNADSQFLTSSENSAARQQVQAQNFLLPLLSIAGSSAAGVTSQVVQQQRGDIATQASLLNTVLGMPAAQVNTLPYAQSNAALVNQGASSIGALLRAINASGSTPAQTYSGTGYNLDRPPTGSGGGTTLYSGSLGG